jgi:flagellar basal-body rod protein FlgB
MVQASIGLLDLAEQRLKYLGARQGVLAENVANADTPAWKAKDLQPFAAVLEGTGFNARSPTQTNPMHLRGTMADTPGLTGRQPDIVGSTARENRANRQRS